MDIFGCAFLRGFQLHVFCEEWITFPWIIHITSLYSELCEWTSSDTSTTWCCDNITSECPFSLIHLSLLQLYQTKKKSEYPGMLRNLMIFLQIGERYPNSQVELHMVSTQVPNMTLTSAGVSVKCGGLINMYARTPDKQLPFLVTLNAVRTFSRMKYFILWSVKIVQIRFILWMMHTVAMVTYLGKKSLLDWKQICCDSLKGNCYIG